MQPLAILAHSWRPAPKLDSSPSGFSSTRKQPPLRVSVNGAVQSKLAAGTISSSQHDGGAWGAESKETLKDYFEQSAELISGSNGGPPRWFSPLRCHSCSNDSPVLLSLPGIDGVGLGLLLHHQRLSKIFDIWCLHIPFEDRTSFADLVKLVDSTVKLEYSRNPNRPIYLVGESFGGCLALAVAARNPNIDLILILANPATSFSKSQLQLQNLLPLSPMIPEQLHSSLPNMLALLAGTPLKMVAAGLSLEQVISELSQETIAMLSNLAVLSDVLTKETLGWKIEMMKSGGKYANSRLHAVKAQTLILASGQDQLLHCEDEAGRLCRVLPNCEIRVFADKGRPLFLEHGVHLIPILCGASFYRRGRCHDYVLDYLPPTPSEFHKIYRPLRWIEEITNPVMLSTWKSGKIVRGLSGIPSDGPVLYVGNHMMLLTLDFIPIIARFWTERNINLRGVAHPMMFKKLKGGKLPDISVYDTARASGLVPLSAINFYSLFSSKSHILMYPGGMREALHLKGEEYKLFWPEQPEFVRMAARFGAKIVPFGCVGEDDISLLFLDYNDLTKIPFIKNVIEDLRKEVYNVRSEAQGEVANQYFHLPVILPKFPGRFYYLFGKPIETRGREHELKNREKAQELYLEVKSEVEKCVSYLKEKRETDPYRNILARWGYQATTHDFDYEIPTFDFSKD